MTIPSASNRGIDFAPATQAPKAIRARADSKFTSSSFVDIIDIRSEDVKFNLKEQILTSLNPEYGPKTLPTLILYDERGLKLFEEVSHWKQPETAFKNINSETDYLSV